ncbi:MAG: 16S rRNA (guanine(966)-N(2))-methyltransferase RsmD [Muribaculaceae bacterium]|nr:16S rRNA (guanine(966)-N(2))-methyltransferase RsmD [Muribaculaceae bacterium]
MRIIRGKYGRRRFDVPGNITARPTTDFARENIFNVIENLIDLEGARCLDLFAGTGAITFELLSRGASSVTAVEMAPTQFRFIDKVAKELSCADSLRLIRGDVFKFLRTARGSYDLIFADPPYNLDRFDEVVPMVLNAGILNPDGGVFIIEHSSKRKYEDVAGFFDHREYGSVNFSLIKYSNNGNNDE